MIDSDSLKHVGADSEGNVYYTAASLMGDEDCLLIDGGPDNWSAGCADVLPVTLLLSDGSEARLHPVPAVNSEVGEWVGEYIEVLSH